MKSPIVIQLLGSDLPDVHPTTNQKQLTTVIVQDDSKFISLSCCVLQWLESLPSDQARQDVFGQVMDFFADGTIQPPHASKYAESLGMCKKVLQLLLSPYHRL